ncbi:MAG: hypothetical protein IKQ80_02390 [Clostridia bacterium]|nr:hypothetical protein [Clostridia bacterium]
MSAWRVTRYEPLLQREITLIALLPEYEAGESVPFEACLLLPEPACEADALPRRLPLEREYCREKGMAVLCVPGWVAGHPSASELLNQSLPRWFEKMFPVRVAPGAVHTLPVGVL